MNEELFGELHEQEENGLYGRKHAEEQCYLHNIVQPLCECTHRQACKKCYKDKEIDDETWAIIEKA